MAIDIEQDRLFTTREVADLLRTSILTVRLAVRAGRLAAVKVGREYRFTQAALDAYLKAQAR